MPSNAIHINTKNIEWTIQRGFTDRGPCYISDIRERHSPYRQLVADGGVGHTVNDPHFGGFFGFGLVASEFQTSPENFWNKAWELTTRLNGHGGSFGIHKVAISVKGQGVFATSILKARGQSVFSLSWKYIFNIEEDSVSCELGIRPLQSDLWIKEPKITFNGIQGYKTLVVRGRKKELLERIALTKYSNPKVKTKNIVSPHRYEYGFYGDSLPDMFIMNDGDIQAWRRELNQLRSMSMNAIYSDGSFDVAPGYCLHDGDLLNQSELTRWGNDDIAGLLDHAWPGGYGAPDCWNTFKPWPRTIIRNKSSVRFRYANS